MLSLENISLHFGGNQLLDQVSATINQGDRIGLVGPNGTGKTTLLRIIAGDQDSYEGRINKPDQYDIGYLPQDGVGPDSDDTLYDEIKKAFKDLLELQEKVNQIQKKLSEMDETTEEYQKVLRHYGEYQHQLEESGVYSIRSNIESVLIGLGFTHQDLERPVSEFSGGWLMRIALAKLLLRRPSLLLLDEPTNHLDIESLQWMEQFLKNYSGALIIVSHDRKFLDELTNRTFYLYNGTLDSYEGNYSYFLKKWRERQEQLRREYKNQQKRIKEMQEFIDKFRYNANKASLVQSRIKKLEKMEKIELQEEEGEIAFQFPTPERSGDIVMELNNVGISYDDNQVFNNLSYRINREDRIAVVGPNGAGKSTFLRLLAGTVSTDSGRRKPGYNVSISYFAQHQAEELDREKTVMEVLQDAAGHKSETYLRTILGCFLFQGDDVFKKVAFLSGGEKSRLALARMLVQPANLLLMDEPTNHLDMQSKTILQQALQDFKGTFVIVSHDRDFLDPLVDKVLEVRSDDITTYRGNVSYFLDKKREFNEDPLNAVHKTSSTPETKHSDSDTLSRKEQRRIEAEKRQEKSRELKPYREKIEPVEQKIEELEKRKDEIEDIMQEPDFYEDSERVQKISREYDQIKSELEEAYADWEAIAEEMQQIEEAYSTS